MPQLDHDLRAGLAALAPSVPTDGVFDQVATSHRGRLRRRRGRRVGALITMGAASIALVLGLVPGGGPGEGDRVVAGPHDTGEAPRLVPTWLPEGVDLHSVWTRPIRPSPSQLRAQVFTGIGDEGPWRLQVATSTAPISSPMSERLTVRGLPGRSSGERPTEDSLTTVQWEEDGRHYEVHGTGLDLGQTVQLVEELEIRTGTPAGVELPGTDMVEDHDPRIDYDPDAAWIDYTFVTPEAEPEAEGIGQSFSIYVWSGVPSDTAFEWPEHEAEEITVRQKPARLTSNVGSLALKWWEAPGTHVTIVTSLAGPVDRNALLRLAEGLRQVDRAAWDAFVASGIEQPSVEDSGKTGEVAWRRFGPSRTFLEVRVAERNAAYLEPGDTWSTSIFHEGRWWTFATTPADLDVVGLQVTHPDGTVEDLSATEITGAWRAPHKLIVAVSDARHSDEPQATHLVLADGTDRPLAG
jgi:hypothetical protein